MIIETYETKQKELITENIDLRNALRDLQDEFQLLLNNSSHPAGYGGGGGSTGTGYAHTGAASDAQSNMGITAEEPKKQHDQVCDECGCLSAVCMCACV